MERLTWTDRRDAPSPSPLHLPSPVGRPLNVLPSALGYHAERVNMSLRRGAARRGGVSGGVFARATFRYGRVKAVSFIPAETR